MSDYLASGISSQESLDGASCDNLLWLDVWELPPISCQVVGHVVGILVGTSSCWFCIRISLVSFLATSLTLSLCDVIVSVLAENLAPESELNEASVFLFCSEVSQRAHDLVGLDLSKAD